MSPIFKINSKDLIRGLIVVVLSVLFSLPIDLIANYLHILHNPILAMVLSVIMGYLAKNLATDQEGKLLGKIKIN